MVKAVNQVMDPMEEKEMANVKATASPSAHVFDESQLKLALGLVDSATLPVRQRPRRDCEECRGTGSTGEDGPRCLCTVARWPVRDPARRYAVKAALREQRYAPPNFMLVAGEVVQEEARLWVDVPVRFYRVPPEAEMPDDARRIYPQLEPRDAEAHVESELELFTEPEAAALIAWLAAYWYDLEYVQVERHDTLHAGCWPYAWNPAGEGGDFWILARSPRYHLPFVAEAWVDYAGARAVVDALEPEQLEALLDLARRGDRATFGDLARALGVSREDVDALWTGTRERLGMAAVEPTER
jgi:hypothetical protein